MRVQNPAVAGSLRDDLVAAGGGAGCDDVAQIERTESAGSNGGYAFRNCVVGAVINRGEEECFALVGKEGAIFKQLCAVGIEATDVGDAASK